MNTGNTGRIGIDIGSTTLKIIILNSKNEIIHKTYRRHKANIHQTLTESLNTLVGQFPDERFTVCLTGSAGMGVAERAGIPFIQEVVASVEVVKKEYSGARTLIDLGGEDAKMVFFETGKQPDIRMNGNCAGGTGAFIDQMADLMHISVEELGKQAMQYKKIYPVASRCGVFAKTDVQNLIARNIPLPDLAMSILHAVALQGITTLARGKDVLPEILCTGGPLTFLPALRNAFKEVLQIESDAWILPENSEYFPAWGAALHRHEEQTAQELAFIVRKLNESNQSRQKKTLPALFGNETEYREWKKNRKIKTLEKTGIIPGKELNCFLGIDSGSTTTKILVIDEHRRIVYDYYADNEGNPLKKAAEGLTEFYEEAARKNAPVRMLASAATGYGEDLIKSAFNLDYGIVETVAHLSGAQYVDADVSFVLDIGGQDMKSIFVDNGVISNIELNEACSSGCGSFLQNFAATMNLSLSEFTQAACLAKYPADLGSRCTVFMNSKVKQSLRENASLADIAAGLAYSVVKNCLFKVLKITNLNRLGEHIVVQGGTFRNDAVYRALELLSGKPVSSTGNPEIMGALGAALYAWKKNTEKTETGEKAERKTLAYPFSPTSVLLTSEYKELQCKGCTNQCSVLRFRFANGNICYAGNKCEKVFFNQNTAPRKGYNAFELKNEIMTAAPSSFPHGEKMPVRRRIGIPRVLNMYENYPFWRTLFTGCGFEVVLSPASTLALYRKGVGSVMSDNICFPAKLVHGHILALVEQGVERIFYPVVVKEEKEFNEANNSYNCPVVSGYPDVVRCSMETEEKFAVPLDKPVVTFHDNQALKKACFKYFSTLDVSPDVFRDAFEKAVDEQNSVRKQLQEQQKIRLDKAVRDNELIFVVAGRPYHADPLIHQKTGQILSDLGVHVLTDDVFRTEEGGEFNRLNMVSQWSYPNRVVQAAMKVAQLPENVQLIQLNSFGCGPDSFFMNETGEILRQAGKNHTVLRIDEIAATGSIRLRLRSFIESLKTQTGTNALCHQPYRGYERTYTEADKHKTILVPWFADFLSPFVPAIGELSGYKIENLPKTTEASAETGLKYGHNEVCYPATLILGDIITALQSGKYDLDNIVVAVTQTGGQCRATNYLSQIKAGMTNAGFSRIPVIAIATGGVFQNEQRAFKIPFMKIADVLIHTILYADALQQMYNSTVVREKRKGETQQFFDFYIYKGVEAARNNAPQTLLQLLKQAVADFNAIPIYECEFVQVGLVGEIYVKYNQYGQSHISEWLRAKRMEVLLPPALDFVMQYFVNFKVNKANGVGRGSVLQHCLNPLFRQYMTARIKRVEKIMKFYRFYRSSESVFEKAQYASEIIDLSHQFGEGWSIAAEVAAYARNGINKIVCIQPFGCIANHVVAKGIEKRLKRFYPDMNLLFLDVDGGMAEVHWENRLHFI
jgi:predicted CoA-substrate-specific enzyme activase